MSRLLLTNALQKQNQSRPPIWFMRQAGRYHTHYQELRKTYSFIDLCKKPEAASEAAYGPIRDFGFDSAILFSDLLFPLEAMGMPLTYEPGPKLGYHLQSVSEVEHLKNGKDAIASLAFQQTALEWTRRALPQEVGLLGFVGGPFTLFAYAAFGSHDVDPLRLRTALRTGLYSKFCEKLIPLLAENLALQARSEVDGIAILDTSVGIVDPVDFEEHIAPSLEELLRVFRADFPNTSLVYYSKGTSNRHFGRLARMPIDGIGIDWRLNLAQVLDEWHERFAIQGNLDPEWLHLPWPELQTRVASVLAPVRNLHPKKRQGWICGLGHGVLQYTPEANVRNLVAYLKENTW